MSAYLGSTPISGLKLLFRNEKAVALYRGSTQVWSDWSPLDLFAGGKQGVWYAPSDKSTLFQDVAGTVPVTKDGDPVALMRDKSGNGNHATQTVSTARPVYKTDGILHWLDFDGVDDFLSIVGLNVSSDFTAMTAISHSNTSNNPPVFGQYSDANKAFLAHHYAPANSYSLLLFDGAYKEVLAPYTVERNKALLLNYEISSAKNRNSITVNNTATVVGDYAPPPAITDAQFWIGKAQGYGSVFTGRVFSFIYVQSSIGVDDTNSASEYLAQKSGVTL